MWTVGRIHMLLKNTLGMWYGDDFPPLKYISSSRDLILVFFKAEIELHPENLPWVHIKGVNKMLNMQREPIFPLYFNI